MHYFEGLSFFMTLGFILIIAFIMNVFQKSTYYLSLVFSTLMVYFVFAENPMHLGSIIGYVLVGYILMHLSVKFKEHKKTMILMIFLAGLPLVLVKVLAVFKISGLGFLGISYMTFKLIQIIIEIYDGLIEKPMGPLDYVHFLLFFPALSSGPIDRSRRFLEDWKKQRTKDEYLELAGTGIFRLVLGLFYKLVISGMVFQQMTSIRYKDFSFFVIYMYLYTAYLFFDFAGYSLMAVGASNILGIETPMNFNIPFISVDIKDFWNRWHITLSTWLRDFVFSRIVMRFMRKKIFKKRLTTAMVAYMINMTFMGFWHGITLNYIAYGFYHGILMAAFEWYQKKSKFYKKNKNKTWYKVISWIITMHLVMFGFLIFSGKMSEWARKLI
ncbi:D-alanyl-lipoteichoic acid biosynthesis protein DltB [Granulicatella adiacens ATCC 49175]|uniref:MBOAT family protein n=1 Tax=Granulicatella adiacens ATCC 49175 TaxID=638301 RepID=C8NH37_9LACT|nr:D-alanyl-lipoteichoic acid biosynthesis protein DltB [Granulicatella adiacens]EEW37014.1 MBOAT family protein [Granulicatella adiacens ATCC 49175]UAK94307.1 D-alanyl-lipoteichoic acid biosynthesis protein DltB [Granulicatella adiacens]UWP38452.1 D-alanyl-lipoteichoic acid biosynthesis protein DltB [Granulicatella adiacens ATCC 49175]